MTEKEREEVVKMLKAFGWSENRCVDSSNFKYDLVEDPDNEFLGEKFCLFKTAEDFLSNFGGLQLRWNHKDDDYNYKMTFDGRTNTQVLYLKWYVAYFRCMLYPVGEYPALPGELFIDEQGYFYIARDTFVGKLGNDIFEILYDFIFLNKTRVYKKIEYWEDAGYSDEFMEQWNYDFDELDKIKQDKKQKILNFLKANGWDENRCVDTAKFRYELMDDPDNEFLGEKFCLFKTAEDFLSNFAGLKLEWKHENDNYDYEMTFNGRVCTQVLYLKWYIAYFRCMLYPVGEYLALPGELFIDEQGYFYIARDTYVGKLGNDIFEILYDFIFLNKKRVYKKIAYWEDAGYSDEFMEQWNYDFDELDKIKQDKKQKILNFLKANGWDENRCVDTSDFRYELMDDPDNEFLGSKFSQFETAKRFLSNFGGLRFEWRHPNNNYEFEMTFDGRVGTRVMYLKWYIAYFRCMLYPVGEYPALPGELFIDEQGYFYIAQETFVGKLGNDIFDILYDFIFLNKKRVYKKITDWEDAGDSDEFMEQWNYDFDELDRMKNDNT